MLKSSLLLAIFLKVFNWVSFVFERFSFLVMGFVAVDCDLILFHWLGRVLGRGALSCVFKGTVGILRATVAIKRLDKEDKECSKAFCRELMIASSLHNPNIVPLLGFCIDPDEGLFLVYKYVSGGNLERYLHGMTNNLSSFKRTVGFIDVEAK